LYLSKSMIRISYFSLITQYYLSLQLIKLEGFLNKIQT